MTTHRTAKLLTLAMAIAVGVSCRISKTPPPPLAGPSELSLSIALTAKPDIISADGAQQSLIGIVARDAFGQPEPNVELRVDTVTGDTIVQVGTLSTNRVTTNGNGEASLVFTAPKASTPGVDNNPPVTIRVLPISTAMGSQQPRYVSIRLVPPTVIVVPGAPIASFEFSPVSPGINQNVLFDGSKSYDSDGFVVSYTWDFGDGTIKGPFTTPTSTHDFGVAKTYDVKLTVKDNAGQESFSYQQVVVK